MEELALYSLEVAVDAVPWVRVWIVFVANPWMVLVLLYPGVVLYARRLHDMGHSGWPLIVPAGLTIAAMAIWDHRLDFGTQLNFAMPMVALAVFVGFIVWGCIDRGNSGTAAALA